MASIFSLLSIPIASLSFGGNRPDYQIIGFQIPGIKAERKPRLALEFDRG
jgi:hypothetical protein